MAHGGKRANSGNKLGSVRPKITDYWSQKDIDNYFDYLKNNYKKSDRLAVFVGEHIMGKAVQPLSDADGQTLAIAFHAIFNSAKETKK